MGKPLTIKPEDDIRLLHLKKQTGAKSKVEVIRNALSLLEQEIAKQVRIKKWKKAAILVADNSFEVFKDFNVSKRFEKLP
jgi:hypothetical protein